MSLMGQDPPLVSRSTAAFAGCGHVAMQTLTAVGHNLPRATATIIDSSVGQKRRSASFR
jgi:hypothetical protein